MVGRWIGRSCSSSVAFRSTISWVTTSDCTPCRSTASPHAKLCRISFATVRGCGSRAIPMDASPPLVRDARVGLDSSPCQGMKVRSPSRRLCRSGLIPVPGPSVFNGMRMAPCCPRSRRKGDAQSLAGESQSDDARMAIGGTAYDACRTGCGGESVARRDPSRVQSATGDVARLGVSNRCDGPSSCRRRRPTTDGRGRHGRAVGVVARWPETRV